MSKPLIPVFGTGRPGPAGPECAARMDRAGAVITVALSQIGIERVRPMVAEEVGAAARADHRTLAESPARTSRWPIP